jgi:hypothetical protein
MADAGGEVACPIFLREDAKRPGSAHIEMNLPAISDEIASWEHGGTSSSAFLEAEHRPSRTSQPRTRAKMR